MRGLLIDTSTNTVVMAIENVESIDGKEIVFVDEKLGKGRMSYNPVYEFYATSTDGDIREGDKLPENFNNEANSIRIIETSDIVNSLGRELATLKFEILMMKGV